jgi:mannan endo-1,6-alpha-mannosidase
MYNSTTGAEQQRWKTRLDNYLANTQRVFFPEQYGNQTLTEYACEGQNNCNVDQRSFKAYISRWLAVTVQIAPFTAGTILPWLKTSAINAAKACSETSGGLACGRTWYTGGDDGLRDVGYQMSTLSIVQANLIQQSPALMNIQTGNSTSDPNAGGGPVNILPDPIFTRKMTDGDKAGAWIVTVVAMLACFGTAVALLVDEDVGISSIFPSSRF